MKLCADCGTRHLASACAPLPACSECGYHHRRSEACADLPADLGEVVLSPEGEEQLREIRRRSMEEQAARERREARVQRRLRSTTSRAHLRSA